MASVIFSKSSDVNDSIFGKSQEPVRAVITQGVEAFEAHSLLSTVFSMDTSSSFAEKYTSETSLGDFEDVGENGAYPKAGMVEGFSKVIEPTTWKSSFEVTQELVEDAKFGKVKSRASIFTTSYNRTREKFGAALLAGGLGKSVTIGGKVYSTTSADGVPLFSTAHPSRTRGAKLAQSNCYTGAFSVEMLDKVQEAMQGYMDDDGNLLNVTPNTNNNAMNFQAGLWNVCVWNYLPKTIGGKPFFLMMDTGFKEDYECMPWVDRVKLTVRSEIDPNTDANVFRGRARFGAGFNNWRCVAICGEGVEGTVL